MTDLLSSLRGRHWLFWPCTILLILLPLRSVYVWQIVRMVALICLAVQIGIDEWEGRAGGVWGIIRALASLAWWTVCATMLVTVAGYCVLGNAC